MPAALRLARFPLTPAARWWPWADSTGATSSGHGSAPLLYLPSRSTYLVPSSSLRLWFGSGGHQACRVRRSSSPLNARKCRLEPDLSIVSSSFAAR